MAAMAAVAGDDGLDDYVEAGYDDDDDDDDERFDQALVGQPPAMPVGQAASSNVQNIMRDIFGQEGIDDDDDDDGACSHSAPSQRSQPPPQHYQQPPQQPHQQQPPPAANDDEQVNANAEMQRMRASLDAVPGYSAHIMGEGVVPRCPVFEAGAGCSFMCWNDVPKFSDPRSCPRPVRVLCVNVVLSNLAVGARTVSDAETPADLAERTRAVAQFQLLGLLSIGTSKGYLTGEHCELQKRRESGDTEEAVQKHAREELDGKISNYVFNPRPDTHPDLRCQAFNWCLEELYDPTATKVVAHRWWKLIYDRAHSDDELWGKAMAEENEIFRTGQASAMPESRRRQSMEKAYKSQRLMTDTDNLGQTACTMYKRTRTVNDLEDLYKSYAGVSELDPHGRPLFDCMQAEIPEGCRSAPLEKHELYGGNHALGPSYALNAKRQKPMIAGLVDKDGPLRIHPMQQNIHDYLVNGDVFKPNEWVSNKNCFYIHPQPTLNNVFTASLPNPVHGSYDPDWVLLEMFWDLFKDSNRTLVKLRAEGVTSPEQCAEQLKTQFFSFMTRRDQTAVDVQEAVLNNSMLRGDSLDMGSLESLNPRVYGRDNQSGNFVVEPDQILKEYSEQTERIHGQLVAPWRLREEELIGEMEVAERKLHNVSHENATWENDKVLRKIATARAVLQQKYSDGTDAAIRLGLRRFDHAFTSSRLQQKIPPGYVSIWNGTKLAIKECGERAARKVNPKYPDASNGTMNLAFAHNASMAAPDFSPWGHWNVFNTAFLSSGACVNGDAVHLMREGQFQAYECCQEVSTFLVMCAWTPPHSPFVLARTPADTRRPHGAGAADRALGSRCVPNGSSGCCARTGCPAQGADRSARARTVAWSGRAAACCTTTVRAELPAELPARATHRRPLLAQKS